MSSSKIFFYFCLSFIFGVFLSSILIISQLILLGLLILSIFLILISWRYEKLMFLGFCIIFLVLGIWRHQLVLLKIENSPIKNFRGEKVVLTGFVNKEPDIRETITRLEVKIEKIKSINYSEETYSENFGKTLVTTRKYPEYKYGDKLIIQGELKTLDILDPKSQKATGSPATEDSLGEGFNYQNYLAKDGIFSVIDFPEIKLISSDNGSDFYKKIFYFKNKLKESLNRAIPRPESAILEALLFGEEQNFSKELKEKFNITGTRHLAAVSGMNITIISAILINILLALGFWRNQAFYFSIIILIGYILMIGAPASGVRAGIMAILFLIAQYFGRISSASRSIVFAATTMLFFNPLLLRLDVGFQLSFLAMIGLIYLQPIFKDLLKKIPDNFQLRNALSATLSAQIFVFPILIYNFGQISLISPIANILILSFIPFTTILGFVFSFVGIFLQSLGQILSWPVYLIISYIIKIINFFSKISWASLTFNNISWLWLLIFYLILGIIVWRLLEKNKLKFLR